MRIGIGLSGTDLTAQHYLQRTLTQLNQSSQRLATMRRINRGADDPAGLIAAKTLEAELTSLEAANSNASRAGSLVQIADSLMGSVTNLIQSVRGNVIEAAQSATSSDTLGASQLEVDAALEAIDRIGTYINKMIPAGKLTFNLSPDVSQTTQLTMPQINTASLGGDMGHLSDLASGGIASLASGNFDKTMKILDAAQSQVLQSRAQFGAFEKYTVDSTQKVFDDMEVNLSSALSQIQDTDVAVETARFVRAKTLYAASTATMALAGQRPRMVLGLLNSHGNS